MFSYAPLWKLLIDKNMTKTELREKANFTMPVLAKMNKNQNINMDILSRICKVLNCKIEEVIEYKDEKDVWKK